MSCTFCHLIEAGDVPWLVREDRAAAFPPLPGGELAPGRTLVIPTAHSLGVIDAPPADLAAAMALVQRVGRAMHAALGATGIVVLNASGPDSGQSVAHLHFHVVPCWADDEVTFWPASRSGTSLPGRRMSCWPMPWPASPQPGPRRKGNPHNPRPSSQPKPMACCLTATSKELHPSQRPPNHCMNHCAMSGALGSD
jgi:histidine triad (HIT) family protein